MGELYLSVVMPALNEEKNISSAIEDTLAALRHHSVRAEVVVINDGSRDRTAEIIQQLIQRHPGLVRVITHAAPQGIGASFWDGVSHCRGNAVVMLPGDNENEPAEIIRYLKLLNDVDMVIPFVFNKKTRSLFRNLLSGLYRFIINASFGTNLNYTNGTVIYRKSLLEGLRVHSSGFFFQTDILIRLIKRGYLFAEVPYRLRRREGGRTKAVSWKSFKAVVRGYCRLFGDVYFSRHRRQRQTFPADSVSFDRQRSP